MITNYYFVGFVDAGESLAECVIRETAEEAGVKINPESFELVDSNHWPNPAGSLMLGSIVTTKTEVSLFLTIYLFFLFYFTMNILLCKQYVKHFNNFNLKCLTFTN